MNRIEGNHFNNYSYHVVYESAQRNLKPMEEGSYHPDVRTELGDELTLELNLARACNKFFTHFQQTR